MQITNISEAKAHLSKLIKQVQDSGEPIIIGKAGQPIAMLSPYTSNQEPRKIGGSWQGKVRISEDFDEPVDEIIDGFYESELFPAKK